MKSCTATMLKALTEWLGSLSDDELVAELDDVPLAVRRQLASGALSLQGSR